MVHMNIGYVKSIYILNDEDAYRRTLEKLNVTKIYGDKQGEKVGLHDLLNYVRQGDRIVVENIKHLCDTIGEFIELVINLKKQGVTIVCTNQKIDTGLAMWDMMFSYLSMFTEEPSEPAKGRLPRNIEDLDACFDLVDQGQLTVEDACKKLNIGKSTYYRRWRQVKSKPESETETERHPEQFNYYEGLVAAGKITVTEAAKQMNIGITTYYRMRKAKQPREESKEAKGGKQSS